MGNEEFVDGYKDAYARFLPYLIFYHSPVVLCFPTSLQRKKSFFKFANYVADKDDFLSEVKRNWETKVEGYELFKLVSKLKKLRKPLNNLN